MATVNKTIDGGFSQLIQTRQPATVVEDTFTPTLLCSVTNPTFASTSATGRYQKIGNRVFYDITFTGTGIISRGSGTVRIGNLPFTSAATKTIGVVADSTIDVFAVVNQAAATYVTVFHLHNTAATQTNLPNNGDVIFSASFWVWIS